MVESTGVLCVSLTLPRLLDTLETHAPLNNISVV